jgi:hypothetical protein
MSAVSPDKAFDRAVDLVINQNQVVQDWARRFTLIETGLGIAVGTIIGWKGSQPDAVILTLIIVLASFGVAFAVLTTLILERHHRWQALYVEMVKRVEGDRPYLYQRDYKLPGPDLRIAFITLGAIVTIGWIALLAILVSDLRPALDPAAMALWLGGTGLFVATLALILAALALRRARGKKAG